MIASLGLKWRDLFTGDHSVGLCAIRVVAAYEYVDLDGVLLARKLRYSNKTFRWQRPGRASGTWLWGLDGASPGLYRIPELTGASRVFVCEGEKAVDRLWSIGLAATCPPCGANAWVPPWSQDLGATGCREIVILPDADRAGRRHAEHLAAVTNSELSHAVRVKVLPLPGLQRGADVVDWLEQGHSASDLENAAVGAAVWVPGALERARLERKRALNRERQRRRRIRRRMEIVRNAVNVRSGRDVA